MPITIQVLSKSDRCDDVFAIYRKHAGTLGFMPRGAFEEGITKGTLLVACDVEEKIIGYLLYRVTHGSASIAHLCVLHDFRGLGIGKALVDELKTQTAHLDGIKLKCRRDFDAHEQWPKWGFVARGQTVGRGADNAEIVIWHLDHNHEDLFSNHVPQKTLVTIDANVFFDLFWPDRPMRKVSGALLEPWIDDIVELALTAEIYNDIDRCKNPELLKASKAKVSSYREVRAAAIETDRVAEALGELYPDNESLNPRDRSDIRHVANTIVAGVKYFITRDQNLLAKAPEVLDAFDVQLLSPSEFISSFDSIEREQEYQPLRLDASSLSTKRLVTQEIGEFVDSFRCESKEKISEFKKLVDGCLVDPRSCVTSVVHDQKAGMTATIALRKVSPNRVEIALLRIGSLPLSRTVLRNLLMKAVVDSARDGARSIHVIDPNLTREVTNALEEIGFGLSSEGWVKSVMGGFHELSECRQRLQEIGVELKNSESEASLDRIGTLIWPGKAVVRDVESYLVPIRSQWAEHFFDAELASQRFPSMSGIDEELHLGVESVYYSASPISIKAPSHILWYVSLGNEGFGSKQVKAVSRLREVVKGTPKELFRRFRRLGVYRWQDLMAVTDGDLETQLTALRFSHTELLPNPLGPELLKTFDVPPPYPGPRPIPFKNFQEICKYGFNTHL